MAGLQTAVHTDSRRRWADMDAESEALAVAEEACETLANFFRAVLKRRHGPRGTYEDWTAELRRETAQVGLVLLNVASIEGFDLFEAMQEEFERWAGVDTDHDPISAVGPQ